jgi:uncharacterized protein
VNSDVLFANRARGRIVSLLDPMHTSPPVPTRVRPLRIGAATLLALGLLVGAAQEARAGDAALLDAARLGQLDAVRARLEAGADPNDYADGYSPLQFAAGGGHVEMTKLLLAKGAKPAHRDHNRDTALEWAAADGRVETVRLLLAAGADPNSRQRAEATPLFAAARKGNADVVKALLEAGADAKAIDHVGATALHEACIARAEAVAALLVAAHASVNARDSILLESPLHLAATFGAVGVVGRLLDAGAEVDALDGTGASALWRAAEQGHLDVVDRLLAAKASVAPTARKPESAFAIATRNGHLDVARTLVDRTPDLGPALVATAEAGALDLAERLRARGVDLVQSGPDALVAAADRPAMLARLLEWKVPVDARDGRGATALLEAAGAGNVESARLLLARGADPAARTTSGLGAAAFMAARRSFYESAIASNEHSRALDTRQPALVEALAALTKRHAEIADLLAGAAKAK